MVILPAKFSELTKAWSSLAYSTGSSCTYSSPGSTQSKNTSKGTTINHGAMHKQHDAIHVMICEMWYAMRMHAPEGKWWSRHQLGKPSMPLETWGDFGWNRYKDHWNQMHGLQMASKTIWHYSAINSTMPSKMQQETKLLHSNIATKHMAVVYSRCLTKDEHWAMAKSH